MNSSIPKTILFRADANAAIGSGHLMRCLALAQACSEKQMKTIFVLSSSSKEASGSKMLNGLDIRFVNAEPGQLNDLMQTAELADRHQASWIVTDGYHFGESWYRNLKDRGHRTLCIDDGAHLPFYYSEIVLNQNIHADEHRYQNRSPQTRLLLGSAYILLRNEFLKHPDRMRKFPDQGKRILITMGGSDPHNTTLDVLKWLSKLPIPDLAADVVLGPSNPYFREIGLFLSQVPFIYRIHRNTANMASLMAHADLAISSAGTTSWEMAYMGVPSLLIAIAENQYPVAEKLDSLGAAFYLGRSGEISPERAQQEIMRLIGSPGLQEKRKCIGQALVDGMGRERVVREMVRSRIELRRAEEGDCRMIYNWANDSNVREASFSSETISWDTHVKWFRNKLKDPKCEMYIARNEEGEQLGQVRFEMDRNDAVISVSLSPSFRNKGYGREIIEMGTRKILATKNVKQVRALIKKDNFASIRAFEKASFEKSRLDECSGEQAFCLVYRKQSGENHAHHH
ncbi:MAG: UDP-2,4-diacetamido-2,4,6-trideoxy-beta-L-altropyranose hydrolase [Pseudomonadota bacterium]